MEESYYTDKRRRRVKLIFNSSSGKAKDSPGQLMDVISQMQAWKLMPEVYLLEPDSDLPMMASDTLVQGITMFVACGGDGTVSAVSKAIAGLPVTLGIIPTGTQNNIALSLGIPIDMPASIAILRMGKRIKIDLGLLTYGDIKTTFLELCTVGLTSSIFPAADDIQHGHLEKIGEFLSTLITSSPSDIKLLLDNKHEISSAGHAVLISNMPYVGRHYRVGHPRSFQDGFLDVLFFGDLSKLNLIGYAITKFDMNEIDNPHIWNFKVHSVDISTSPPIPVMVDGLVLGEGPVHVEIMRRALGVMTAAPIKKVVTENRGIPTK